MIRIHHLAIKLCLAITVIYAMMATNAHVTRADDAPVDTAVENKQRAAWHDLNAQGVALSNQGRFADALEPLNQALVSCDADQDHRNGCVALINWDLCYALIRLNRAEEGIPTCRHALDALKAGLSAGGSQQLFDREIFIANFVQTQHSDIEAEALFRDAIAIARKPDSNVPQNKIGNALIHLASVHRVQGRLEEAASELREVVAQTRESNVAEAIEALGLLQDTLWKLLRDDDAGAAAKEALAMATAKAAPGSSEMYFALKIAARQSLFLDRLPDAEDMTRKCIEHLQKYTDPDNINLALRQWELADILADEGKVGEALEVERQLLAHFQQHKPNSDDVATLQNRIGRLEGLVSRGYPALTLAQLSEIADAAHLRREALRKERDNRWAEAEDLNRKSLALAEEALPHDSQQLGTMFYDIGIFFYSQERYAEAQPLLSRAADIFKIDQPFQREMYGKSLEGLAGVYEHLGEPTLAETRWQEALALLKAAHLLDANDGIVALHNYGAFLRNQSRFNEAEEIFRNALASREKTYGPDSPEAAVELNSLGLLYLSWGRYTDAEQTLRRALSIQEEHGGPPTETKTFVLINLATLEQNEGRYDLAEDFHRRALSMRETLYGKDSAQAARTLRTIADDELQQWHLPEAEDLVKQAIALGAANGDTFRYQTSTAWQLLGRIEASEQRPEDGVISLGKAVALDEALVNPERRGLIDSFFNQANALFWAGKYQDAISVAEQSLNAAKRVFSADAPGPLAAAYDKAADFRALAGYTAEATDLLRQALDIRVRLFGDKSLAVALSESRLVPYLLEQGRIHEADQLSKHAFDSAEKVFGADNPSLVPYLRDEASVSVSLGHMQEAEVLLRRAMELQEATMPADSPALAPTLLALANDLAIQGRGQEAEPLASRALKIVEGWTGSTGPALIGPLETMANVLSFEGKWSEVLDTGRRTLEVALKVYGAHHPATAGAMRIVGNSLARSSSSHGDAESFLEGALAIDKAMPAPVNFWLAADLNDLALVEAADGKSAQARDYLHQSVRIFDRAGFADSLGMAVVLANLSRVDTGLGFEKEAASTAERAVGIFQKSGADQEHRDRAL